MNSTNQMAIVPCELLEQALDAAAAVGMQDVADELDRILTPSTKQDQKVARAAVTDIIRFIATDQGMEEHDLGEWVTHGAFTEAVDRLLEKNLHHRNLAIEADDLIKSLRHQLAEYAALVNWWKDHLTVHLAILFGTSGHSPEEADQSAMDIIRRAESLAPQVAERSCSLLEDWVQHTRASDQALNDQINETRKLLETQSPTWSTAARDLLAERRRQVREEGHTLERDDRYTNGELAPAASAYAFWADPRATSPEDHIDYLNSSPQALWPWAKEHWKPTSQRLMLIKAGALILAELERIDRLAALNNAKGQHNDI